MSVFSAHSCTVLHSQCFRNNWTDWKWTLGGLLKPNLWVKGRGVLHSGGSGGVDDVSMSHLTTRHVIGCAIKVSSNHDQSGTNRMLRIYTELLRQHSLFWTLLLLYSRSPPEYLMLDSIELFSSTYRNTDHVRQVQEMLSSSECLFRACVNIQLYLHVSLF